MAEASAGPEPHQNGSAARRERNRHDRHERSFRLAVLAPVLVWLVLALGLDAGLKLLLGRAGEITALALPWALLAFAALRLVVLTLARNAQPRLRGNRLRGHVIGWGIAGILLIFLQFLGTPTARLLGTGIDSSIETLFPPLPEDQAALRKLCLQLAGDASRAGVAGERPTDAPSVETCAAATSFHMRESLVDPVMRFFGQFGKSRDLFLDFTGRNGLFFGLGCLLIAGGLMVIGSGGALHTRPGTFERSFVGNISAKIAAVPMALVATCVFFGGTVWTVVYSFTDSKLLPRTKWVGLDQYDRLWDPSNDRWWVSIENLAIYGILSLIFSLLIGFVLAVLMDQKIRFENTFRTILLYPFALSFIVTGLVWQWVLNPEFGFQHFVRGLGWESFSFDPLYNQSIVIYGILIAGLWQGTGLIMVLMLAGLRGIDEEIWKASRVDGIPAWKTYLFVVIPMMRPVFITTLVLIASSIVRVYDLVVAQTSGGPGIASEVPAKYVYDKMFLGQNLAQGFAASTMMLLTVLIILIPWAYLEFGGKKRV